MVRNLKFDMFTGAVEENTLIVDKENLKKIIDEFGGDWASEDDTYIQIYNMKEDDYAIIKADELINVVGNLKKIYINEIQKLKNEQIELKKKLDRAEAQINLQIKKRQISDEQINEIKELINQGLSYKKISEITKWSTATISKIKNGIYD